MHYNRNALFVNRFLKKIAPSPGLCYNHFKTGMKGALAMKTGSLQKEFGIDYPGVYELLDRVPAADLDCGTLCGAACCRQDPESEEECGIYLLPGEASMHDRSDPWLTWSADNAEEYDFPVSWTGTVDFVRCGGPGHCRRELRPIQCRTFPLAPHLTEDGELVMILCDIPLPYSCPLLYEPERLLPEFVENALSAWKLLIGEPLIRDLVELDSRARDEEGAGYTVVSAGLHSS